ncbi:MAG: Hpt domain-containing protein [Proteobacteria bacterium]|nr:MAG: Hpt domain-containing protein [Pseudomonadota bacterium]
MEKIIIVPNEETVDLLPGYVDRRRAELAEVERALSAEDYNRLATVGHNVKGTAGSYGIPGLGDIAEEIHTAAVNKNRDECARAIGAYRDYLLRVEVAEMA